jgi:hypothetical protein
VDLPREKTGISPGTFSMGWTLLVDMATTRSSHDGLPVSQIVDGFMDLLVE